MPDGIIEALHARGAAGFDDVGDLENAVFADAILDGGGAQHDFDGGDHAGLVVALQKSLADDADERAGQKRANLVLLAGGIDIDDTLNRLRRRRMCARC